MGFSVKIQMFKKYLQFFKHRLLRQ